jgi:uncharacterized protein YdeI (YjbR/CyaY-like superfamily)
MPEPDISKITTFRSVRDLGKWLQVNHNSERELWVKIYKKSSGIPSVTWKQVVIEALCWGWIDGIKKSLDDQAYLQRITPRQPRSNWSRINTEHVERLILEGRMEEPGLVHVRAAKEDGRWESAYSTSDLEVPADFITALNNRPKARQFFESLTKSNRYIIAYGLESAKRPETRERRFKKFLDLLDREEKPN